MSRHWSRTPIAPAAAATLRTRVRILENHQAARAAPDRRGRVGCTGKSERTACEIRPSTHGKAARAAPTGYRPETTACSATMTHDPAARGAWAASWRKARVTRGRPLDPAFGRGPPGKALR